MLISRLIAPTLLAMLFIASPASSPVLASGSQSAAAPDCRFLIHVTGLRNNKGKVGTTLFVKPDGWPENNDKAYKHGQAPIANQEASAEWLVPAGDYAVAMLHDENENHKLDRNFFHWPLEGFGFANNPKVGLTAPPFKDAIVHVSCPVTSIEIKAIYK
jgi:uncharacterized protein (DUF2141 family)